MQLVAHRPLDGKVTGLIPVIITHTVMCMTSKECTNIRHVRWGAIIGTWGVVRKILTRLGQSGTGGVRCLYDVGVRHMRMTGLSVCLNCMYIVRLHVTGFKHIELRIMMK